MKILNQILITFLALLLVVGCNEGIDPISPLEPGPDEGAPVVKIKYPLEGTQIKVPELTTSITIDFEVSDDIEISSVKVDLDGVELVKYDEFLDYRRLVQQYVYEELGNGVHVLTISANDLEGNATTETVNFEKALPYTPLYQDEILYMPFDGSYMDMISFETATVVGTPGFAGESLAGLDAYAGADNSYLTFPAEDLQSDALTAVFWMKINAVPDRAGILVMGPIDEENPDAMNNRTAGFRFFRENAAGNQRFKLNVGFGDADSWFDGGEMADVDPSTNDWVHFAFTISPTMARVYINGQVVSEGEYAGVDWTGCDLLSIMSGAPRFNGWDHKSDLSYMDELRMFSRELTQSEIQNIITTESGFVPGYSPKYDGEIFYMSFEESYTDKISETEATVVGTPGFAGEGKVGDDAYAGAAESYLTFPAEDLMNNEFSATFWYKVTALPDRAGILVLGPPDTENPDYPEKQNLRTFGFRFFREKAGDNQRFKLNLGSGDAESWFDGGEAADIALDAGWKHMAFTVSGTDAKVYIDGVVVSEGEFPGIDWTGCDILSIGSGAPRFTGWDHYSDEGFIDELRFFNKALTLDEIETIMTDEQ